MIRACFYRKNGLYYGFVISGHAGGISGQDIVCAGVSSAVMLTVNTISDFLKSDCIVKILNNVVGLKLNDFENNNVGRSILFSLKTHLEMMAEDHGGIIVISRNI